MAESHVAALRSSVTRLNHLASQISDEELTGPAYPAEWTNAQVLSHLGSGAVITQRRLEDALAGRATPDDFAQGVWDTWNAKSPVAQRDDALAADAALMDRIQATTEGERDGFTTSMGPMELGFAEFVGMRLNEHAFHTWDLEVVRDPLAVLPPEVTPLVVDNLGLVARFTAKPNGQTTTITVKTTAPERGFTIDVTPDHVTLRDGAATDDADLALPAEAFARLVYGRLDANHAPPGLDVGALDRMRAVFPGP
jgi:uncharacterized protein (TIGR03083 family)